MGLPQPQLQVAETHFQGRGRVGSAFLCSRFEFLQNDSLGPRPDAETGRIRSSQAPPVLWTAESRPWPWAE